MTQARWKAHTRAWRKAHPEERPKKMGRPPIDWRTVSPNDPRRLARIRFYKPKVDEYPQVRLWEMEEWMLKTEEAWNLWIEDRRLYARCVAEEFVWGREIDYFEAAHKGFRPLVNKKITRALALADEWVHLPLHQLRRKLVKVWAKEGLIHESMEHRIDSCDDPRYRGIRNTAVGVGILREQWMVLGSDSDMAGGELAEGET